MTVPQVKDILTALDRIAPFALAESWDNSGLQAGDPSWAVHRVLVALDVTADAMAAAAEKEADLLITHHPLVMRPEKSVDFSRMPGRVVYRSARDRIAVVAAHTNLDKARDGLNDYFAQILDIACTGPLSADSDGSEAAGIGRIGTLKQATSLKGLAQDIKRRLGIPGVRVIGALDHTISRVALCTGSGGSLTDQFLASPAEAYITGDLKYHEARDIETRGRAAVDVGHFASEHIVVDLLTDRLGQALEGQGYTLEIYGYKQEKDPFRII